MLATVVSIRKGWFRAGHGDLDLYLEIPLGIRYILTCHSKRCFYHLSIVKYEVLQFMDFSFILFFFPWLASKLGNTWTQKPHQPPKKPVLKLQVNFSRLHEAAMALTKGGWSFRAAMVAQVNMLLNCSCTQRRKSARRLCEMLLPKICLNRFSSSVGNYQIKWFKTENWKNSSSRGKKVSLGAWCPLPRNL